jgi:hypothetical protein
VVLVGVGRVVLLQSKVYGEVFHTGVCWGDQCCLDYPSSLIEINIILEWGRGMCGCGLRDPNWAWAFAARARRRRGMARARDAFCVFMLDEKNETDPSGGEWLGE